MLPTIERVRETLSYDPKTGILTWLERPGEKTFNTRFGGQPALTCVSDKGYATGRLDGHLLRAHRAAFVLMTGRWPDQIDHISGDRLDNRWANLREVDTREQARNRKRRCDNSSGLTGVCRHSDGVGWQVTCSGRYVGYFLDLGKAKAARLAAAKEDGFHANHDRIAPLVSGS